MATPAPPSTPTPPSQPPVEILYAVPVGTVITWFPPPTAYKSNPSSASTSKTLVFPQGFALCDGSVVNDPDSPFNGMSLPNLVNMFILGSGGNIAYGDVGGNAQINLGTWGNPQFITSPTDVSDADNQYNNILQRNTATYSSWRYVLTNDDLSWNDGNHHHYVAENAFNVPAPGYVALIMIMRIK